MGDCLGDITSEMQPDQYIEEFVSEGPKNYAHVMVDLIKGCKVCKVRKITLNYAVSQLINFDLIKNMFQNANETATLTVHTDKKIKRKWQGGGIHIVTEIRYKWCLFSRGGVY
jgi:hypothetical protein